MSLDQVDRKLAAILAADVEGYSRLMEADEIGTLRLLTACRAILDAGIARHRGRIFNTAGDSVLAEFASVVDAVECAVAAQQALGEANVARPTETQMRFRIGIHVGDVLVQDGNLFGDGVNIAARLEALAEPGGICVSGAARDHLGNKVPVAFADLGERAVKNIAEKVRAYRIAAGAPAATSSPAITTAAAPRMSIVVLPFADLGPSAEQDYFADGITEDLTTDLSRIRGSFVISRNTAFTYKGKPVDAKQVGHDLGVRYVLEGSVRRGGERVRVNAQLIDAETGAHLWAERFDHASGELTELQDAIVARLARALGVELVEADSRRASRERPDNPTAVDLTMRGWAVLNRPQSRQTMREARTLYEAALRLDERNPDALTGVAYAHALEVINGWSDAPAEQLKQAEDAAARALVFDPNDARAHFAKARVLQAQRRHERALGELDAVLALDRNFAQAYAVRGQIKQFLGRTEETAADVETALRLSPRDNYRAAWFMYIGSAMLSLGDDEAAINWLRRSIGANPNFPNAHFLLAAAYAHAGRDAEARAAAADGLAVAPDFTIGKIRARRQSGHPRFVAERERHFEGMRKAGLPE